MCELTGTTAAGATDAVGQRSSSGGGPAYAAWLWLGGPVLILGLSFFLSVGDGRQVVIPWPGVTIPETCAMHVRLGMDCPGCGLTRSFIHMAHGDVVSAMRLNPVGLVVFSFVVLQLPLALLHICQIRGRFVEWWTRWNQFMLVALMVALTLQWLVRLCSGELLS